MGSSDHPRNTLQVFISSPGDVAEEREKARQVLVQLQHVYGSRLRLAPILWEDLPLGANASFQQGIDLLLSETYRVEIAVFIIWSRLGSPLGPPPRADGTAYRSGTEREFELMLEARVRSERNRPHILAYVRVDDESFNQVLDANKPDEALEQIIAQRKLARQFVRETFHDAEGRNLRAYHTYDKPISFAARLKAHLRVLIDEMYGAGAAVAWEGSPYRGLRYFDLEHAPIFFGRRNDVSELELLLRRRAATGNASVIITGASGSGKSSLARAGVAHDLTRANLYDTIKDWRFAALRPGAAQGELMALLVRALTGSGALPELAEGGVKKLAAFQKALTDDPHGALALTFDHAIGVADQKARGETRLLLLVDQLEELWLDQAISSEGRESFLRALEALATNGSVWVMATLRSDLYPVALESDGFVRLKRPTSEGGDCDGIFEIGPLDPTAILRLIQEPAALAGLRFEKSDESGRSLDQDLLRDAAGDLDALPLLEYALEQLFEARSSEGMLTFAAYKELGGVDGALGRRAEQTFLALPTSVQDALERILPLLITVDLANPQNTGRRQARMADLTVTEASRTLTESLIAARFLTTDEHEGIPVASFTHEALLRRWERLRTWVEENRELLQLYEHVRAAASDWAREKEKRGGSADDLLLAAGLPLSRGERTLEAGILSESETEFVRASLSRERRTRLKKRRRLQLLAVVSSLAAIILGLAAWQATRKTREVQNLLAESDSERADRLFDKGDAAAAIWFLCRAISSNSASPRVAERLWFSLTQRSWPVPLTDPVMLGSEVTAITFDASGERFAVATRDGSVAIFSSVDGKSAGPPLTHPKRVRALQFSPDATKLLTACDDAQARLWDVGHQPGSLLGVSKHEDVVSAIAWSSDGKFYATGSWDKQLRIWEAEHPEKPVFAATMKDKVHTVEFDPTNPPTSVLGVAQDEVCVWKTGSKDLVLQYPAPADLNGASYSADGGKVVSFDNEGDVVISDIATGFPQWAQLALGASCRQAAFSPDGEIFVVVFGARVRAYSLQNPPAQLWEEVFPDLVSHIKFAPDGKRLLTACDDGKVQIFDSHTGRSLSEPIVGPGTPVGLDFHALENRVLVARSSRTARIWSLSPPAPLPSDVYSLGAPRPLLLKQAAKIVCVVENGRGIAFSQPDAKASPSAHRFDFAVPLTAAAVTADSIVGGGADGTLFAMNDGQPRKVGVLDAPVSQLAFSNSGALLAAGGDNGRLAILRWPEATAVPVSWKHNDRIGGLAWLGGDSGLVSASWDHGIARIEPLLGGTPSQQWVMKGEPQAMTTDKEGRTALIAVSGGGLWVVTPTSAELAFTLNSPVSSAAFNSDGGVAAVGAVTGIVSVLDMRKRIKMSEIKASDSRINAVVFGMNDRWIGIGTEDGQARVYEAASGEPITESMPHSAAVRHLLFSQDSRHLITATNDGRVVVWPLGGRDDMERAVAFAQRVMHTQAEARLFIPGAETIPQLDPTRIRRLIQSMEREGTKAFREEIDSLTPYLDSRGSKLRDAAAKTR